jgi:hypothetical protein
MIKQNQTFRFLLTMTILPTILSFHVGGNLILFSILDKRIIVNMFFYFHFYKGIFQENDYMQPT